MDLLEVVTRGGLLVDGKAVDKVDGRVGGGVWSVVVVVGGLPACPAAEHSPTSISTLQ